MDEREAVRQLREALAKCGEDDRAALVRREDLIVESEAAALHNVITFCKLSNMETEALEGLLKEIPRLRCLRLFFTALAEREKQYRKEFEQIAVRQKQYRDALAQGESPAEIGESPADLELELAGNELCHVLAFLEAADIYTTGLNKLNAALVDLNKTGRLAGMLRRPSGVGMPPDPDHISHIKGTIGGCVRALMDYTGRRKGHPKDDTTNDAIGWIAAKAPEVLARKIDPKWNKLSRSTIKAFYERSSKKHPPSDRRQSPAAAAAVRDRWLLERDSYLGVGRMLAERLEDERGQRPDFNEPALVEELVLNVLNSIGELAPTPIGTIPLEIA
jgi:hypothetical protein